MINACIKRLRRTMGATPAKGSTYPVYSSESVGE
jgi:hypothetical protein